MTEILLIRHAEAEGNATRRIHGQYDSLLTSRGLQQVERLQSRLGAIHIDAVYSSDLYRARKTASAAYRPHILSLHTDTRLREVDMGEWEDVTFADAARGDPEQWFNLNGDIWNWRVADGEQHADALFRIGEVMREIAEIHDGQTVAVFTHGMISQIFFGDILGVTDRFGKIDVPHTDNTAVSRVIYDGGAFKIDRANDVSHLPAELSLSAQREKIRAAVARDRFDMRYVQTDAFEYRAYLDDDETGLIALDPTIGTDGAGVIERYELRPEWRGRGLGIQLLGQAISTYRALGRDRLRVENPADAVGFFEKLGFTRTSDGALERNISVSVANRDY
ncbi:MAG: GNAT family N-acetyltransferase [Oscillospiraceae bacterium]|jgi:probable phosphoglycerate mutase|nr:GNAT family N-acetyltransferase [Oscillospiraceae bacterium]